MDVNEFRGRDESKVDSMTEDLAQGVIGAAIEVHRHLGSGLPETSYRNALSHELKLRNIDHEWEFCFAIKYKGVVVGQGRLDLLVGKRLVVELKAVDALHEIHSAQALGYLRACNLQLALLINFNVRLLKNGIKRIINTQS